jgi:hypothetical protein
MSEILHHCFSVSRASLGLVGHRQRAHAIGRRDGGGEIALLEDDEKVLACFVQSVAFVRDPSQEIVRPMNV